ncbi:MAG: hypothetical protein WBP03_05590 [Candidatus Saccharimonadales bacterium]
MSSELVGPPALDDARESLRELAQNYAELLGDMCLEQWQTPDFQTSGLAGKRMVGFYSLVLESGQLSLGVSYHEPGEKRVPAKAKRGPALQVLDIHEGWRPFCDELLKDLGVWARVPLERQKEARDLARRKKWVSLGDVVQEEAEMADIISVNFLTGDWENRGPDWRPSTVDS